MRRGIVCVALSILPAGLIVSSTPTLMFRDIAAEAGLDFHHFTGATGEYFMPEIMGAGAALFDYDNDGDLDIYLIQGTAIEPGKKPLFPPPANSKPGNRLFRNMLSETGKLTFVGAPISSRRGGLPRLSLNRKKRCTSILRLCRPTSS